MAFWTAIPVIGGLLDTIFNGIDKVSTTDEERLKLKQEIMATAVPVITLLIETQRSFDQAQAKIREVEIQSGDAFVRRVRPTLMVATFLAWAGIEGWILYLVGATNLEYLQGAAMRAFGAFGLIGGLFTASRGIEKGIMQWAQSKNGNGK